VPVVVRTIQLELMLIYIFEKMLFTSEVGQILVIIDPQLLSSEPPPFPRMKLFYFALIEELTAAGGL
jgi:hypothetical protein